MSPSFGYPFQHVQICRGGFDQHILASHCSQSCGERHTDALCLAAHQVKSMIDPEKASEDSEGNHCNEKMTEGLIRATVMLR